MSKEMQEMMFLEISQNEFYNLLTKEGDTIKEICDCMCNMHVAKTGLFTNVEESAARVEEYTERYVEVMSRYKAILDKEKEFLDKFADIYKKNYMENEGDSE